MSPSRALALVVAVTCAPAVAGADETPPRPAVRTRATVEVVADPAKVDDIISRVRRKEERPTAPTQLPAKSVAPASPPAERQAPAAVERRATPGAEARQESRKELRREVQELRRERRERERPALRERLRDRLGRP